MAFEVARRVIPAAIVLRLDVDHDLGAGRLGPGVMRVDVIDHHIDALRDRLALRRRCDQTSVLGLDMPSMIMPLSRVSSAWAIFPPSPGTTIFRAKPKAVHSQSMAAAASR